MEKKKVFLSDGRWVWYMFKTTFNRFWAVTPSGDWEVIYNDCIIQ